jgi:hypothetical protein
MPAPLPDLDAPLAVTVEASLLLTTAGASYDLRTSILTCPATGAAYVTIRVLNENFRQGVSVLQVLPVRPLPPPACAACEPPTPVCFTGDARDRPLVIKAYAQRPRLAADRRRGDDPWHEMAIMEVSALNVTGKSCIWVSHRVH